MADSSSKVPKVKLSLKSLDQRINSIVDNVTACWENVVEMQNNMSGFDNRDTYIANELNGIRNEFATALAEVHEQLQDMKTCIGNLEQGRTGQQWVLDA